MKIKRYSFWGIFPALGWAAAGMLAAFGSQTRDHDAGVSILAIAGVYLVLWFVAGLFMGYDRL